MSHRIISRLAWIFRTSDRNVAKLRYVRDMKRIAPLLVAALVAMPAQAQNEDLNEGINLLDEGARLLLRGLMNEMSPALKELEHALRDLSAYHPPEVLPNGDIIIRRKEPLDPKVGEDGEVEL